MTDGPNGLSPAWLDVAGQTIMRKPVCRIDDQAGTLSPRNHTEVSSQATRFVSRDTHPKRFRRFLHSLPLLIRKGPPSNRRAS